MGPTVSLAVAQPSDEAAATASAIEQAYEPPPPAILAQAPGELIFEGLYRHRRAGEVLGVERRWIKRQEDRTTAVVCELPFIDTVYYGQGGPRQGLARYEVIPLSGNAPILKMEFATGKVWVTRSDPNEHWDRREFAVPALALFEPNSEVDPYCVVQVLEGVFDVPLRSPEQTEAYDWDRTGNDLAHYRGRVRNAGLEEVTVPCGRFRGRHVVIEQLTSADTRFEKVAQDITDMWILRGGIIARIVRNRDQYEVDMLHWKKLKTMPDLIERRTPVLSDGPPPPPVVESQRLPLNEADRIEDCWTLQGFVMPYRATVFLTPLRSECGGPNDLGVGTGEDDCRIVLRELPKRPEPPGEVEIGDYEKGDVIPFCITSSWRGESFWASTSEDSYASRAAFQDTDGSLGGESAVEQFGPERWLMRLDGANTYKYDDDDNDVLILLRLESR